MSTRINQRIEALEALPEPVRRRSPEDERRHFLAEAAACGLTEEDVIKLGGWERFCLGRLTGSIRKLGPDPEREAAEAAWEASVAKHGGDVQAALLEELRAPWRPKARR